MARIPLLRVSLLSCVLSAVFFVTVIWVLMAEPGAPPPPPAPAGCIVSPLAARPPTAKWLEDYFGTRRPPAALVQQIGLGSYWPIPPPGMSLVYRGWSTIINPDAQTVKIPGDKIYHIHSIALAFDATGASTDPRTFVVRVLEDADNDDFETVRLGNTAVIPQGTSSQYVFAQGAAAGNADPLWGVGVLPIPFFIPPGYTVIAGYPITLQDDDISESRWSIESWDIVPLPAEGSGAGSGAGSGSGGLGGGRPYFVLEY